MAEMKEILKKAFELNEIEEVEYVEGFFSGKSRKYIIPEENLKRTIAAFPFLKNAIKAGLILKDKKSGTFFTTDRILNVRANDKKSAKRRQFFSINGDDSHERTTLYDGLVTVNNLKYISKKFGVATDEIRFTIRHENGNINKVVNYVELDKKIFGNSETEIKENIGKINDLVKYERNKLGDLAHV